MIVLQKEFVQMMKDVQKACTTSTVPQSVSSGDVLLAQFSFDNQWYRALVKGKILFIFILM